MSPTDRTRSLARLTALATALALATAGCNQKKEENLSDDEVWEEATGEPAAPDLPDEPEVEPAPAEPPPAGEGAMPEGAEPPEGEAAPAGEEGEQTRAPAPTEVLADGARLYGERLAEGSARVALGALLADAPRYDGSLVRTEGEIARVCQAMGCWMELRESAQAEAIRVPMAGHAFFLPKDVAGRRATVEGRVKVRAPSPEAQAHLRAEGALAAAQPVSLEATGVVVH